jgi:isopenicillin-N N-acyltransferase-like protein
VTDRLPEITISGPPDERGFQHGHQLKDRVEQTIEFYTRVFGKPENELFRLAEHFQEKIRAFNPDYATEIESLAEGAAVDARYIYALNARSEILSLEPTECTALYFETTRLLGQNWDWAKPLEDLIVLMRIEQPDAPAICMVAEPGIIGKIGLNENGLGVCLNILRVNKKLDGVPIHIVLRAVLDSADFDQALEQVKAAGLGKASNILIGSRNGQGAGVEFAGDESFVVRPENNVLIHTNHYLGRNINPDQGVFCSSYARMRTATERTNTTADQSINTMKSILLDRSNPDLPIHRAYIPDDELGDVGTVCSVMMDLPQQVIHVKKGNTVTTDFVSYSVRKN